MPMAVGDPVVPHEGCREAHLRVMFIHCHNDAYSAHLSLSRGRRLCHGHLHFGVPMAISPWQRWIDRMKGAALLRIDTYEEVEADQTATGQAAGVVALVAIAQAIGSAGEGGFGIV